MLPLSLLLPLLLHPPPVQGHARLMEPPSRASMWRLGFDNPPDFNDHQGFCGGFNHQFGKMGGRCGICGDPADSWPRQHEAPGGRFANGLITRQYRPGQDIVVKVDVTANHKGFFTFKMCANNNTDQDPRQECFDRTILQVVPSGEERYYLTTFNTGVFTLKLRLPPNTVCTQCILQWTYTAGNNWGSCEEGGGPSALGCGPQENFRACADISVAGKPSKNAPIALNPAKTITTKSRAPNVFVADLFNTKTKSPEDNEIDGTNGNNKPIPFLIRNTTAQGMPISIGALRPVSSPPFMAFNSFVKRLPPPQKYVFETRQVLKGDVVDPYNYLRALFRGEVILTSDKLPTFATPRVWGLTTSSALGRGSYTTRSPQGYNPFSAKEAVTTTTAAPFFAKLGLASKGEDSGGESKMPLPVGMLGTPTPSYKNLKTLMMSRGRKLPAGGTVRSKLLPRPAAVVKTSPVKQPNTLADNNSLEKESIEAILKKMLQMNNMASKVTKAPMRHTNTLPPNTSMREESIETILKKMLQKNNPSFAAVPAVPQKQKPTATFPILQAVPTSTPSPRKNPQSTSLQRTRTQTRLPQFSAVPAVPLSQTSSQLVRTPKQLPEFRLSLNPGNPVTTVRPVTKFPTFRHFPATNSLNLTPKPLSQSMFSAVTRKPATLPPSLSFRERTVTRPPKALGATFSHSLTLERLATTRRPQIQTTRKAASLSFRERLVTRPPTTLGASFSQNSNPQRLGAGNRQQVRTTQRPASLPRGTTRAEIRALLSRAVTSTPPTTLAPQVQSTTNRAEVLRLLQQLLGSVKPSTPTTTIPPPRRTTRATTTTTSTTTSTTTKAPIKFASLTRAPRLRFDSVPRNLRVTISPLELPPGMTTANPLHPHSPFPHMEAPQHDLLTSHLQLARDRVPPASSVHPASPFPNLQAPDLLPNSRFQTHFTSEKPSYAMPRQGGLPPDPARPGPTPPPGPLKLRLDTGAAEFLESQLPRSGRHHKEHTLARWHRPQPTMEAPPPLHPRPRTRLIAPRSQRPAMNRRLSLDGPTEASLTPLELLAMDTVPRLQPDTSFFGTPRSRQLTGQTPLERLAGQLKSGLDDSWGAEGPVPRSRHQRGHDSPPREQLGPERKQLGPGREYKHLPGVQTGTTALGLVEHRGNQPFFHVPIFTTPIPKNGKFLTTHSAPLRGFAASLRNITSTVGRKMTRVQEALAAAATKGRDILLTPPPRQGHGQGRDILITPPPRQEVRGLRGRTLDTFSRYTKLSGFRNQGQLSATPGFLVLLPLLLSLLSQ